MRLNKNNTVEFNEFLHEYTANGRVLIGVTSLLHKHGLAPDYGAVPEETLKKAAERGTAIHQLLQDYDDGKPVVEDENLRAYKALGLEVHCSEYLLSDNEVVASFADKVLEDCSIADVKTSSSVDRRYVSWQTSIYAYLFERQNPSKKVPHLYCVHVRDGKAKLIELERVPDEKIKALIRAEREGVIWHDDSTALDALPESEMTILVDALNRIAEYKAAMKAEEERAKALQDRLLDYMIENALTELPCDRGRFVRSAGSVRTSIDSTRLRAELPDIAEKYSRTTQIKGGVTFKPNNI